jgi:cellulose synthase/poly-beta-1,6-N-acetylglucosamine synthase-like glycosyltransferase
LAWFGLAFVAAGVLIFFIFPAAFTRSAHYVAAGAMFFAIVVVAVHYACYAAAGSGSNRNRLWFVVIYMATAIFMLVALCAAIVLKFVLPGHWLIIAEILLILGFAVFWIVQTYDLWNVTTYSEAALHDVLGRVDSDRSQARRG